MPPRFLACVILLWLGAMLPATAQAGWPERGPDGAVLAPVMPTACETVALPALCDGAGPAQLVMSAPADDPSGDHWTEVDLPPLPGVLGLELVRHHVGRRVAEPQPHEVWGRGWRLSYEARWRRVATAVIEIEQADGTVLRFDRPLPGQAGLRAAERALGQVVWRRGAAGEELLWTWPNGRQLAFAPAGHLEQIVAPGGEFVSLRHDAQGRLLSVTDPQGRSLRLRYLDKVEAVPVMGYFGVRHADTPVGRFTFSHQPLRADSPPPHVPVLAKVEWPSWVDPERRAHRHANRPLSFSAEARVYHHEDKAQPLRLTGVSHQAQRGSDDWTTTPVTRGRVSTPAAVLPDQAGLSPGGVRRDAAGRLIALQWAGGMQLHIGWDADSDRPAQARLTTGGPADAAVLARWRWSYNRLGQLASWERVDAAGAATMHWRHEHMQQRSVVTAWHLVDGHSGTTVVSLRHDLDADGEQVREVVLGPQPIWRWRFERDAAGRWSRMHSPGGLSRALIWRPREGGAGQGNASMADRVDDITPWTRLVRQSLPAPQVTPQTTAEWAVKHVQDLAPDRWVLISGARRGAQPRRGGGSWQLERDAQGRLVHAREVDAAGQTLAHHRFVHGLDGLQAHAVADAAGVRSVGLRYNAAARQWHVAHLQHPRAGAGAQWRDEVVYPLDAEGRPLGALLPGSLAVAVTWPMRGPADATPRPSGAAVDPVADLVHPGGQRERLDLTQARRWSCAVPCWWLPPVVRDAAGRVVARHVPVAADQWVRIELRDDEPSADDPHWQPVRRDSSLWQTLRAMVTPASTPPRPGPQVVAAPRAWRLVSDVDAP